MASMPFWTAFQRSGTAATQKSRVAAWAAPGTAMTAARAAASATSPRLDRSGIGLLHDLDRPPHEGVDRAEVVQGLPGLRRHGEGEGLAGIAVDRVTGP